MFVRIKNSDIMTFPYHRTLLRRRGRQRKEYLSKQHAGARTRGIQAGWASERNDSFDDGWFYRRCLFQSYH